RSFRRSSPGTLRLTSSPSRGRAKPASTRIFPISCKSRSTHPTALMPTASASSSTNTGRSRPFALRWRASGRTKRAGRPRRRVDWLRLARLGLDLVPDQGRHIRTAEIFHRADAGRRGDVDLGEVTVDHVDADEEEPALAQRGADPSTDVALAGGQLRFLRRAA